MTASETMSEQASNRLHYPGYRDQLTRAAQHSGHDESITWEITTIAETPCVTVSFVFGFMGGTMGEESGGRLVEAIDRAATERIPLVTHIRTGGARVQEGVRALMQMHLVTQALRRLRRAGVAHIAIAAEPTTGGVWASLGASADIIIAVQGATVAFAGARVRDEDPSDAAFHAEGKLRDGFVDVVASERDLKETVERFVRILGGRTDPVSPCPPPTALGSTTAQTGWEAVLNARADERPRAAQYLDAYFDDVVRISGDRVGGRDPAMLCGIGSLRGTPVAFAAQSGRPNTAAGFRTATRLLLMAESLRLPVLTLVDTPGAANDAQAEVEGIGTAIQHTLAAIHSLSTPVTSLVIGEGGSGGALALCAPGNTWITPDAYFSVISPEGAAAILYRDTTKAAMVADRLRITPSDTVELGLVNGIVAA